MAKIAEGKRALARVKELEAEVADLKAQLAEARKPAPRKSTKN